MIQTRADPLKAGEPLAPGMFAEVRLRTIFSCCKWDPQVEDVSALADFPLLLARETWDELRGLTERLSAETLGAERELCRRPELLARLALPRKMVRHMKRHGAAERPAEMARLMRFDFHWTREGWRVSEVNSDVPGGFVEASGFSGLMRDAVGARLELAGDPAGDHAQAIVRRVGGGGTVALVHATAYSDDRQVMEYLALRLGALGIQTIMAAPDHLEVSNRGVHCRGRPVDGLVRFFPAEWLMDFRQAAHWRMWLCEGRAPCSNPASALFVQSKRLPLVWDELETRMDTWRSLLPETRATGRLERPDPSWVIKPALGRVGEGILMEGVTGAKDQRAIVRWLRLWPGHFVAQRRFETVPLETPRGPRFVCLGVYSVDGRAAGVYGRMSTTPVIDHRAQDVAVLIQPRRSEGWRKSAAGARPYVGAAR